MAQGTRAQTLVIPGFAGSPEGHWQQIWADERPGTRMVMQKNWHFPKLDEWSAALEEALLAEEDGAFLVAHSFGCILAARIGEGRAAHKVRAALLVAPGDLDVTDRLHPGLIQFGDMPEKKLPFPTILLGSRNDSYMSEERARHFATLWGARYLDMGYVGHINLASGFGRFERGYRIFDDLLLPLGEAKSKGFAPHATIAGGAADRAQSSENQAWRAIS